MISNKKLKTKALPFALVGVMGLSGCVLYTRNSWKYRC